MTAPFNGVEMAEPSSSTSVGLMPLVIAALGPMAGQFAVIIFGALAGSLWALKAADTNGNRGSGALLVLRLVLTATALAGTGSLILHSMYGWPAYETLAVVALCIAAVGDRWQALGGLIFKMVRDFFARLRGGRDAS